MNVTYIDYNKRKKNNSLNYHPQKCSAEEKIASGNYQLLAKILYSFVSRKEISMITHNLMYRFGNSLVNIFNAPVDELIKVKGVGYETAIYLSSIPEIARKYCIEMSKGSEAIVPFERIREFLVAYYSIYTVEVVALLCLNNRLEVISDHELYRGSVNSANVNVRKIIEIAFFQNATSIVLTHNHPNGFSVPSQKDIDTTKQIYSILNAVDLELTEHYVVSGDNCFPIVEHINKQFTI